MGIDPFKREMREMARRTFGFPAQRGVKVTERGPSAEFNISLPLTIAPVLEQPGHKSYVAEWLYERTQDAAYFKPVAIDTVMMAVVDVLRCGALPVLYTDLVITGASGWFTDEARWRALIGGLYEGCRLTGMALVQGESASLPYLVGPALGTASALLLAGCAIGVMRAPYSWFGPMRAGDLIFGVASSGLHANGTALVIERALKLQGQFLYQLWDGRTVGEHALIPTANYVPLVEALIERAVGGIRMIEPVTGGGVTAIITKREESFTYRIQHWTKVPPLMQLMLYLGVSLEACLRTFNWGVGLYLVVGERSADDVGAAARDAGYELVHLGQVEPGERKIIFEPEGGIELPLPGS